VVDEVVDWEAMKRIKLKPDMSWIDNLVMEAYEIGHAHGSNAMRIALGQKPRFSNRGWGKIAWDLKQAWNRRAKQK